MVHTYTHYLCSGALMTNRLDLFENAKATCVGLLNERPGNPAIESIVAQLDYLISIEDGTTSDRTKLRDITIGVLAAREIEPLNMEVAEVLHAVAGEARRM